MPTCLLPLLALASLSHAADPPADMARWRTVTAWEGTFTVVERIHSTIGNTIENNSIKTASGHIVLDRVTSTETLPGEKPPTWAGATVWKGKAKGRMTVHSRSVTLGPGGKLVAETIVDGGGMDERSAELATRATKGQYAGRVEGWYADTLQTQTVYGPTQTYSSSHQQRDSMNLDADVNGKITNDTLDDWKLHWDERMPPRETTDKPFAGLLPNKGLRLTGNYHGHGVLDLPPTHSDHFVTVSWTLWPLEEIECVVDIDGYDDWLPRGNWKDLSQAGNSLKIRATLQTKEGKPTTRKVESFLFDLPSVSREPGVCMNAPVYYGAAPIGEPDDLYWRPGGGITPAERQLAVPADANAATATLYCRDFGAYGTLHVAAIMEGDSGEIPGHLRGDPARTDINIPNTEDNSLIATAWKKANKVLDLDDMDDSEELGGYLHPGDGLSMYEEYRGFVVRGKHVRTDPRLKTFFVHPKVPHADAGLRFLQSISGIQVLRIDADEYHGDNMRIVNFSHGACHIVDQHGVVIVSADIGPHAGGQSPIGPPKYVDKVEMNLDNPTWRPGYRITTIAHELCHALGVNHHGDGNYWMTFDPSKNPGLPLADDINVAVQQGECSGDQTCIMRYRSADFVERAKGDPRSLAAYGLPEPDGTSLCITDAGTGVNDPAHRPFPKCGKAQAGRGKCFLLLTVSDMYPGPTRP
jgi:hypothetical protein